MASGGSKSAASVLLIVNLVLYFIAAAIAVWVVNHGIQRSRETGSSSDSSGIINLSIHACLTIVTYKQHTCIAAASALSISARLFPIYLPIGNTATGFFVIFSLIAGVVGMATSLAGLNDVAHWNAPNLHAAASSSLATWALTLLAMGYIYYFAQIYSLLSLRLLQTLVLN